eukprot:scaffold10929_cov32-Tisochrysis_lutea.AAC.3
MRNGARGGRRAQRRPTHRPHLTPWRRCDGACEQGSSRPAGSARHIRARSSDWRGATSRGTSRATAAAA